MVLDHLGEPAGQIDVAQDEYQPVEQKVLHGGVEFELHLAAKEAVERVDLVVEFRHVVAVAHRREGRSDLRGRRAGLIGDAHDERRPAAIDHRVGELGRDDLAAQPVAFERVGKFLRQRLREIASELAAKVRVVRHG